MKVMRMYVVLFCVCVVIVCCRAVGAAEPEEADSIDLGEIVMTAARTATLLKDTTATVTVIDRKEIERMGAVSTGDVLRKVVGIHITQYGSRGSTISMSIRGANATQVLVLVNGRPVNAPSTGMFDLSQIPAERIERIEIMRTPAASLYGANAVGGVIQIFTKEPSKTGRASASVSTGGFGVHAGSVEFESPTSGGALRLGTTFSSSRGERGNSLYHAADGDASVVWNLSGNREAHLKMSLHRDKMGLPGPMPPADPAGRTSTQTAYGDNDISSRLDNQRVRNASFQLDTDLWRGANSGTSLKFYRDKDVLLFSQEYLVFNFGDNTNHVNQMLAQYNTDNFGGDLQYERRARKHKWVAGFNFRHERFSTTSSLRDVAASTQTDQNWKNNATNRAIFVEDEWKPNPRWVMSIGSRWDRHAVYGSQFSPYFSALRRGAMNTRISVTRAFRAPSMNDLFWPEDAFSRGNSQLTPEKAMFYELGLERPIGVNLNVNFNVFSRRTRDMIAWAPTGPDAGFGPKWQPSNLNTLRTRGAELQVSARLSSKVKATISDTYLNSKQVTMDVVDGMTNAMSPFERDAAFTPRNYLKWNIEYSKSKFTMSFDGRYVSSIKNYYSNWNAFPVVTMDTKSLPAHSVADCNFSWRMRGGKTLRVFVANIFDNNYAERFGNTTTDLNYPMPGRGVTVWLGTEM